MWTSVLIVSVFCLSAAMAGQLNIPPEMKELIEAVHHSCQEETGVSMATIEACKRGEFADDMKLKCFFKCGLTQLQAMDDNGDLDLEVIEGNLPEEAVKAGAMEGLKKCKAETHADVCEKAMLIIKCLHREKSVLAEMFE